MSQNFKDDFLDEVCRHVSAKVEHKSIRKELGDHVDDAVFYYGQAEAIEHLGDPASIGNELNTLYNPWVGRLWQMSRVTIVILMVILLTSINFKGIIGDGSFDVMVENFNEISNRTYKANTVQSDGNTFQLRTIIRYQDEIKFQIASFDSLYSGANINTVFSDLKVNGEYVHFSKEPSDFNEPRLEFSINKNFDKIDSFEIKIDDKLIKVLIKEGERSED